MPCEQGLEMIRKGKSDFVIVVSELTESDDWTIDNWTAAHDSNHKASVL